VLRNWWHGYFAIIDKGVTERENAEQLGAIRESLKALEGGRVIDV